jgi:hypothetical protein
MIRTTLALGAPKTKTSTIQTKSEAETGQAITAAVRAKHVTIAAVFLVYTRMWGQ